MKKERKSGRASLRGSMVALVTPFKGGKVDEAALRRLVDFQIENGTDVLVPCGTTGESATLSHEEHDRVIAIAVEQAAGRVPIVAGTGSNATDEAIRLTRHAKAVGVEACLSVTPYYNRPTQEGLFRHYEAIAKACDLPILLYNVPGRTGVNLLPETVARLAAIETIVGVKEASGNMQQVSDVIALCPKDFAIISGEDLITMPMLAIGAQGVISVTANAVPKDMAEMIDAFFAGDRERATALHYKLRPLHQAMFFETNPIPVKAALSLLKMCENELRLPLTPMSAPALSRLRETMQAYGLRV